MNGNQIDDGGPAFPSHGSMGELVQEGMTLRDYHAAHAPSLPQHVKDAFVGKRAVEVDLKEYASMEAHWRHLFADAMLKERQKK